MDTNMIRQQLQEVQGELRRIEAMREVLLDLVKGYEGYLRLHDQKLPVQPPLIPGESPVRKRVIRVQGTISARSAILQVVQDAHGEPLHSAEIWRRAEMLGAVTNSPHPKDVVDLTLVSLRKRYPIERSAPRTYRWVNGADDSR